MNPIPLSTPDGRVLAYACGRCRHIGSMGEMLVVDPEFPDADDMSRRLRVAERCCHCRTCGSAFTDADDRRSGDCADCENWTTFTCALRRVAICIDEALLSVTDYGHWERKRWLELDTEDDE